MPNHTETQLKTETIFTGRVITLTRDEILLENGVTTTREVVHHSGGAGIVALNSAADVALVRQYRYAAGQELIEIPAGKIDPGETPRATALRELAEEAGCAATSFESLGHIIPTCGYCTEVIHLYLATGLTPVPQNLDAEEFLDVLWLPLEKAVDMVMQGDIIDGKTVAALLKAHLLLTQGKITL